METVRTDAPTPAGLRLALTREALGYGAVLLVSLALRAPQLGAAPFSQSEAHQAMAALQFLTQGGLEPTLADSPLIFAGLVASFAMFSASEVVARFLPLLYGVGLVLAPLGFRRWFGRMPMLITSALLALSPGAVAASRHVDGSGAAVFFALMALLGLWRGSQGRATRAVVATGVWFGLALLADFGALVGMAGLGVGLGAVLLGDEEEHDARSAVRRLARELQWGTLVAAFAATVFLVGTLFGAYPRGLGAVADLLGRLVRGVISRQPDAPFVGGIILLYEPVVLLFGLIGLMRGLGSDRAEVRFLSGWAGGALLLGFAYPGGLPAQSLWMIVPLAGLAGLVLAEVFVDQATGPVWSLLLHATLTIALLSVASLWTVSLLARVPTAGEEAFALPLRLLLVGSLGMLVVVTSLLWASIWGPAHTWRGLALGLLGMGILVAVTNSAGLAYTRASNPHEPWNMAPGQPALEPLAESAQDVSTAVTGHPLQATVTVEGTPDGLLAWTLRDFDDVRFVERLSPEVATDIVLTSADADPQVGERYVGQDFVIVREWRPAGLTFDQFLRWVVFRQANTPTGDVRVILWVREDIYTLLPNELR